uniref:ShKT domain-containing protein n=1 Tax=Haemonchus contortus TaxID=6289 RepID=A0A7I5EAR1_HAECO
MRSWLALIMTIGTTFAFIDEIDKECMDKSPYCNTNDCTVRPGYALEYCRKTCGDCEPFCHNSHFVSCKDSRKPECDSMLKDYCPLLCGACRPIKKKSEKKNGAKSTSRTPLTAVQFSKPKVVLPNTIPAGHDITTSASKEPVNLSSIESNTVQDEHAASPLVHRC